MDRKLISHRIGSILDDISRLSNALYALDTTDIQRYPDNYETLSIDAALRAERIACRLRHLIYSSTNKLDTQTYELVAVAKDGSHKAYPQVKTGNVSLDGNDYKGLLSSGDKVFLFTVNGAYYNTSGMDIIDKKALIDFIYGHKSIMPGRIRQWL